jgi:hypothetical protein
LLAEIRAISADAIPSVCGYRWEHFSLFLPLILDNETVVVVLIKMYLALAGTDNGKGSGGQNNSNQYGHDPAAPELYSSALGGGLVLLVGGIMIWQERRRTQR